MLSPGLVDLQVNGFGGVDFNAASLTSEALDRALEAALRTGVTTLLPTLITAHPQELEARFLALDRAISGSRLGADMCPAYHLEGPFLNPAPGFRGCHPPEAMTPADAGLVERLAEKLSRPIILVTCAPEMANGLAFVAAMANAKRIVAIGHSNATAADVAAAADVGLRMSTHLGNGIAATGHKFDNPIMAQLADDRLCAGFIADGIHIPRHALKVMIRARGIDKSILVTDAVSAAAAPVGAYPFAGMVVDRTEDGSVRVAGGQTLAGSSLRLDDAVRNVVRWGIATAPEAITMASLNPARLLADYGVALPASDVEWSDDLQVRRVRAGSIERRFE